MRFSGRIRCFAASGGPASSPTGTPAMRAHSPVSACQYLDGAQPAAKLLPTCVGHSHRLQQMRNAPSHATHSFEIGGVTLIVRPQPTLVQASHPMRIAAALECARLMCGLQLQPMHCCWCVYTTSRTQHNLKCGTGTSASAFVILIFAPCVLACCSSMQHELYFRFFACHFLPMLDIFFARS